MLDLSLFRNMDSYSDDELYALYDLISKRFVYVHTNFAFLKLMAVLFSSRYRLNICRVDCAENFHSNIIDNGVALNWGIKFKSHEGGNSLSRFDYLDQVFYVDELCCYGPIENNPIAKDIPYMNFVVDVLGEMNRFMRDHDDGFNNDVDFTYANTLGVPFKHSRVDFINGIFQILYLEFDFDVAKKKVQDAFDNFHA